MSTPTTGHRVDMGACRNPSLNIRPDLARAATAITGPSADDELVGPRGTWWWTGKAPAECPGFDKAAGVLRSLPLPNTRSFTRQSVLDYFDNTWTLTEVLFAALQTTDAFIRQPYHQLRHPMMFYYGHPAVLYINKFRVAGLLDAGINQYFEQLFETGVDEMSWDDLSRGRDDWPPVREVHEYRKKAYEVVRNVILNHPALDKPEIGWDDPAWAIFMGFEHERIHIETSSVLIRELPLTSVRKPEFWPDYHPSVGNASAPVPTEGVDYPVNSMVTVAGEKVVLGKDISYPSFGWDNEYGRKEVQVAGFRATKFKVTNGEFLRFVKAGGYMNPKYWSTEGWGWKTFRNVKWPTFWMPDGPQGLHRYKLRVLFDAVDMRWDWPVDANYHEARAFAAWRTEQDGSPVRYRLISEAEHNLIRNTRDRVDAHLLAPADHPAAVAEPSRPAAANERISPDVAMLTSGNDALTSPAGGCNIQLAYGSQNPVTELPPTEKGFHDTFGSAWEWGEDHYAAYPGFKVHPFYEDFSVPCFAGKHQLIFGGSFISTGQLASKFARYQFRPHFFQHATFRLVRPDVDMSLYDGERYGAHNPVTPFFETSCMDSAPPHVGDGPCCSVTRRAAFTPTRAEEAASTKAKLEAAQVAYESDAILAQYLSLHYGPMDRVYPDLVRETGIIAEALDFPRKLAECLSAWADRCGLLAEGGGASGSGRDAAGPRALDLGCAVGRSSFELSRRFVQVVGVDISKTFIEVAAKIRDNGRMDYECAVEGEITERLTAALPSTSSPDQQQQQPPVEPSRCRFLQGDACDLPSSLGQFDAVLAANLLCRVPEPAACLAQLRTSLRPGGVALLTSPFSWLEQYTDRSNWLGGGYKDGLPNRSADALKALLAPDFDVLEEGSMPLIIREHARKYQLINAHKLVIRRK
ncbi:hypothetical protein PLESTB_000019400 [Pleodorina starrii]|uniref:Generic methyltransferase n=1 Tax=Pleodorina starrii TaxID=330485 RepID=A0A9W6EVH6_9CHLO|nr:hypothetical protein PLESTM_001115400 [Pleodorina starrii]GLC47728.1 hypothetical protein PLESTB_000019400 [Pleodorina starrii]GLC70860.1 hypothetical protein PLESTF_001040800 [Pleodorina starrii]